MAWHSPIIYFSKTIKYLNIYELGSENQPFKQRYLQNTNTEAKEGKIDLDLSISELTRTF